MEVCARFVSLLPFKHDLMLFKDLPNMYSDCQEFLDLGGGDYEEHAILLANFFIYIDEKYYPGRFKTYLVYGYSMPEGKNVFVMRKFANPVEEYHKIQPAAAGRERGKIRAFDIEIWNPCTGECFNFEAKELKGFSCTKFVPKASGYSTRDRDPICPLKHIFSLVSTENIYANI